MQRRWLPTSQELSVKLGTSIANCMQSQPSVNVWAIGQEMGCVQEREGRWWWEDSAAKECGLHSGNIEGSSEAQAAGSAPDLFTDGAPTLAALRNLTCKPWAWPQDSLCALRSGFRMGC